VKILSCLLLVILTFAAPCWPKLFPLMVTVALAVCLTIPHAASIWRVCWMFRWLLLFTLLMHLLLSSGRTLWGQSWLSRDGLLLGCYVCAQMLMAIVISALLAITTTTNTLSGTFGWFVRPLQRLGCETEEWQKILLLTMDFIPVVQEEMYACSTTDLGSHAESSLKSRTGRWSTWRQKLHGFLERLMARGDTIAQRIAGDQDSLPLPAGLPPLMPMALHDQLFSLAITLVIACYWLAG
jgi:energy-coupling factor transport system permease protein